MLDYSTMTSADTKCPGCQGYHTFINQFMDTRPTFRLFDCADGFMKELPEDRGKIIKKVKGSCF